MAACITIKRGTAHGPKIVWYPNAGSVITPSSTEWILTVSFKNLSAIDRRERGHPERDHAR